MTSCLLGVFASSISHPPLSVSCFLKLPKCIPIHFPKCTSSQTTIQLRVSLQKHKTSLKPFFSNPQLTNKDHKIPQFNSVQFNPISMLIAMSSIASHNLIISSRSHYLLQSIHINHRLSRSNLCASPPLHFQELQLSPSPLLRHSSLLSSSLRRIRASQKSGGGGVGVGIGESAPGAMNFDLLNLDVLLSLAEAFCVAPLVVFVIGFALNSVALGQQKLFQMSFANRFFVWQFFLLVGAVCIGSVIRRRQWRGIYLVSSSGSSVSLNLVERVEKLEEDLRSSVTIIRVLSRQLEKLGIRFRVTRNSLKEPIAETSVLAKKNSEATRALAAQEEILEKELGEIQKVLLAMQEQQQKQLELILAIGKAGKFIDSKRDSLEQEIEMPTKKEQVKEMEMQLRNRGAQNDKS